MIALGIILAVGVAVGSASGKTYRVGSKVGLKDYFPSIQQALNIAQPGDTVLIEEAQTYPERLKIPAGVTLTSIGPIPTVQFPNDGKDKHQFVDLAGDAAIRRIRFDFNGLPGRFRPRPSGPSMKWTFSECEFVNWRIEEVSINLFVAEQVEMTLKRCVFRDSIDAGGDKKTVIVRYGTGNIFVDGCEFRGGKYVTQFNLKGRGHKVTIRNSVFMNNVCSPEEEAAYILRFAGSARPTYSVEGCLFANNRTERGLIYVKKGNKVRISNCTFADIRGPGPAIHNEGGKVSVTDCIFARVEGKAIKGGGTISHSVFHEAGSYEGRKVQNVEPKFEAGKYILAAGSPLLKAGTDGDRVGCGKTGLAAATLSEGGKAVALAECCISNSRKMLGAKVNLIPGIRTDAALFGESQSRIIVSCNPDRIKQIEEVCVDHGVECFKLGVVGGDSLTINKIIDLPLLQISQTWRTALEKAL